jgi:uncharacterized protein (DUF433 family)
MPSGTRRPSNKPDIRDRPAYGLTEAARYVKVAPATLRSWVAGRPYPKAGGKVGQFRPLIHPPKTRPPVLTFWNLIEAHVLRALRVEHSVSMEAVRKALLYAEERLQIQRLLLSKELCTEAGRVFLDRYGQLIDLSASGQIALRRVFDDHLRRVEWGEWQFPVRLYPFLSIEALTTDRPIAIDPAIAFGRPILVRAGVATNTIAERVDSGETVADIAEDYGLTPQEIEQAVLYERAA